MLRIFNHYVPKSLVVLGAVEFAVLAAAAEIAARLRIAAVSDEIGPFSERLPDILAFASVVFVAMLAVGMYQSDCCRDLRMTFIRLLAAFIGSVTVLAVVFYLFPDLKLWRSMAILAYALAALGIMAARLVFTRVADLSLFKWRVIVLGAGPRAARIGQLEKESASAGFRVIHYIRMHPNEQAVSDARDRSEIKRLSALVAQDNIDEIVLASEERRGTLPVAQLIECKLRGTRIADVSSFLERETGRVALDGLQPSWIIFSDGFKFAQRANEATKRLLDVAASLTLFVFTLPILLITAMAIKVTSRGPVFYMQERVGRYGRPFKAIKFRSMRVDAEQISGPQWAATKDPRMTAVGRLIRAIRIDEIPQILNVLKGDMSFIGPRPERPFFVAQLERELPFYAERHAVKPGITGWAQINYPYGASVEDARHKLEYDLYYVKNFSVFFDLLILIQTVRVILWQNGVR
ncbi:MAG: TIGR03013 family XrtA/PEP-CTERM system glycosyltransferase [Pseudomonadota bacterium]